MSKEHLRKIEYVRTPLQNVRTKNTLESQIFPLCYGRLFALYITYVASANTKKNSWQQSLHKLEENCMGSQLYERSYLKAKRMLFLTHPLLRMWWGERVRTWQDPQNTTLSRSPPRVQHSATLHHKWTPPPLWWSLMVTQKNTKKNKIIRSIYL